VCILEKEPRWEGSQDVTPMVTESNKKTSILCIPRDSALSWALGPLGLSDPPVLEVWSMTLALQRVKLKL
jgi:hypothetical protein